MNEAFSEPRVDHGAWEYEPATKRTRWSEGLYAIHGVPRESFEPTVESIRPLVHPDDRDTYTEIVRDAIATRTPFACQHRIVRPDGKTRNLIVRGSFVEGTDEVPDRLIGTTQDVTAREEEESRMRHLAHHDSISGLYNRARLIEELTREISSGRRSGDDGALLVLDLDRISDVNDSLGHIAGDALLASVAVVLRGRLRDTDTLARIGGDEFGIVLPGCAPDAAEAVASQLIEAVASGATIHTGDTERRAGGSIGVVLFGPGERRTAEDLLGEAELAMHRAKANGRGQALVFSEDMRAEQAVSGSTEDELRGAVGGQELRVQYQPIVALDDGAAVGCEALVRWAHPIRGMVGPSDFVSVAEETGLISKIGRFVLERACSQAEAWRREGRELFVSVNVSPRQLSRPDFIDDVSRALDKSGLSAGLLCLEFTEASLLRDGGPVVERLRRLKALGVRLAIDDFGAGASSFGLLRLLPVDQIKIDRLFIQGLGDTTNDRAVVAAVVSLAREFGLTVIAEGVEEQRQHEELHELGAQLAQGFLYSPARYAEELELDRLPSQPHV
ncbi:MAG: EAL domain-containing protein [Actinomycetota bacterium]|nr:EAL domain-containing protein [Actinomycetota bacterium]